MKLQNLAAERSLLGIILNDNRALDRVAAIQPEDFGEENHGNLLRLFRDLIDGGRTITAASVLHDAQDAIIWDGVKISEYLAKLEHEAPGDSDLIVDNCRTIMDLALRSRTKTAIQELERRIDAAPLSISGMELREDVEETLTSLFPVGRDGGTKHLPIVGDAILARLQTAKGAPTGLSTGLAKLDELLGSLIGGRLYIFGAAPGGGKSVMLARILRSIAGAGIPTDLFSPEMGEEEIVTRQMAAETDVSADKIERNYVNNPEYAKLYDLNETWRNIPFSMEPHPRPTLAMIRSRSMRLKRSGGLGAIGVDHIHYVAKPDRRMQENEAIDENLEGLKGLARDLDIPILIACQFGTEALRDMNKWPHRRPSKGDLLFSGIVERHADVIVLIHREEYMLNANEQSASDKTFQDWGARVLAAEGKAELILGKNRGGKSWGRRVVGFDGARARFTNDPPSLMEKANEPEAFDFGYQPQ